MKLRIEQLKPNPFKKEISNGKYNETQLQEIKGNLGELGLMGAIPIVNIKGQYHLVNSHHRLEALKRMYGKKHQVEVTLHKYSSDQLFKGMVIENLSQRGNDFKEELENIRAVENYLNKHPERLECLRTGRKHLSDTTIQKSPHGQGNKLNIEFKDKATAFDIQSWLQLSDKKWGHDVIR